MKNTLRRLNDCMEARYPVTGDILDRITCRKGHELPRIATVKRCETTVCRVCQACLDFNDADAPINGK
jgi:hypothetical protein